MKGIVFIFLLIGCGANANAGFLKAYHWGKWENKKSFTAYGHEWTIMERDQYVEYSSWHISQWLKYQNFSNGHGEERYLVNKALGLNENILDLIVFPQKDGGYKSLLKKPFLDKEGGIDYYGNYGVYERNGILKVWLNPNSETGTDRLLLPYTDCGFLTAKEQIAYATDRRHEPEVYYGEFDPEMQKFYMRYTSAPIPYVYWSEWGASPVDLSFSIAIDRNEYRKDSVWDAVNKKFVAGELEVRPEYVYLGRVEEKARLPLICKQEDFKQAKDSFQAYLKEIRQPVIDKELSRMSEHEKATFKREDCDGIGLNYDFGCKQIDSYGFNDNVRKNVFPKGVKPPRIEDRPD